MNFTEAEYRRVMKLFERLVVALEAEVVARREDREKKQLESHRVERITASVLMALVFAGIVAYTYRAPLSPIARTSNVPALGLGITVATILGALVLRAIRMGTISLSYAMFTVGLVCSYAGFAVLLSPDPASPYLAVVCGWSLFWFWFKTYAAEDIVDGKTWMERMSPIVAFPLAFSSMIFLFVLTFRAINGSWLNSILIVGALIGAVALLALIAVGWALVRNVWERRRGGRRAE